jgi:Zn-dependent protease with chaperone function
MIDAIYFDGQSSRRNPVTLIIHKRVISMRGEGIRRNARLSQVDVSERLAHAPRILRFKDGATVEIADSKFDKMLRANRYREPKVTRWQQNWPLSLLALVTLIVMLISGYQWGLPWAADHIAQRLPSSIEQKLGDEGLALLDKHYLLPSRLSLAEQARLRKLFAQMKQPHGDKTSYRLEFRRSNIGPNALALPNGVILMTDELVALAGNDDAVLGVLGHELGHVRHRHSTRRLLQAMGVGVVVNVLIGDVSGVLATVPSFLLDQKYSRDFERESDQYAIDMMHANQLPLSPMADLFAKMGDAREDGYASAAKPEEEGEQRKQRRRTKAERKRQSSMDYLRSHPSDEERIAKLRAADAGNSPAN